jgi:ankyrin repeat protein
MSKDEQIIKLLLENGPDLSALKNIDNDNDPLKIAIDNAAAECAQILFSHLPSTGPAGFTPLMSAIHANRADLALLFLKSGHSDPSHLTNQGQFALRRMTSAPDPEPWFAVIREIAQQRALIGLPRGTDEQGQLRVACESRVPL